MKAPLTLIRMKSGDEFYSSDTIEDLRRWVRDERDHFDTETAGFNPKAKTVFKDAIESMEDKR